MFTSQASPAAKLAVAVILAASAIAVSQPSTVRPPSRTAAPERPRRTVDTTFVAPPGPTITVPRGGDLQAAINAARPGSVIVLDAGATYYGNFTLPKKAGSGWIYVQSSALAGLPAPGTRVTPAQASLMPRLIDTTGNATISTVGGAHHFRLVGLEVATTADAFSVVDLGGSNNIVIDRSYIHATTTGNVRYGVIMNGASLAVVDSHLSDLHHVSQDAAAIIGWDSPGPLKIANNGLEASGVNLFFGGQDPTTAGLIPSDIEIRGNYVSKPLSWRVGDPAYAGIRWSVKNLLEFKNAQRVLVDGNIFENTWTQADQGGFAIVLTPRNQQGTAPWSAVQDITFTHNIVRHTTAGINILGWDNLRPNDMRTRRILIQHNLFEDIGAFPDTVYGGVFTGMLFLVSDGPADVIIDHNTALQTGAPIHASTFVARRGPATGFTFTNNIALGNQGVSADDSQSPLQTLTTHFPGHVFARNVLPGGDASSYPPDNFFPASLGLVGFVNVAGSDYRLAPASPYKNAGTDGKDIGADIVAIGMALPAWGRPLARP